MSIFSDIGDAISGVTNFVGDLRALEGGNRGFTNKDREREFFRNWDLQREFAQHGVRWKAEDARAAGLHPLFALGAQTAPGQPVTVMGGESSLGRVTKSESALKMASLEAAKASAARDFAQASYYDALAAKERNVRKPDFPPDVVVGASSPAVARATSKDGRMTRLESHPLFADAVQLQPDAMASRSIMFGGETAGPDHPAMRQFEFPGNFRMLLPATQGGGVPEEIDVMMMPFVIGANVQRYGKRWLVDMARYFVGTFDERKSGVVPYRSPWDRR